MKDLETISQYMLDRAMELRNLAHDGNHVNPWVFVCMAVFVKWLKAMSFPDSTMKEFVGTVFPTSYRSPEELTSKVAESFENLSQSFSLVSDRERRIVISHRGEGISHLAEYRSEKTPFAWNMNAEDLAEDLFHIVKVVFEYARTNQEVAKRILDFVESHRPIVADM